MPKIDDQQFAALKESLNNAIHEIVHTCRHLEEDDLESAAQCLMTAQSTLDRIGEEVATLESSQEKS